MHHTLYEQSFCDSNDEMQQRNADFVVIVATKNCVMRSYKKLFNTKKYHINKIGERQHYLKLNRLKAKLYVSKTSRPRGLITDLYTLPSPS